MTHKRKFTNHFEKNYIDDGVTLLRAETKCLRQHPDVKHVIMFNGKVVLNKSNDKKHNFRYLFDLRKWNSEFVDFVCNHFGLLR